MLILLQILEERMKPPWPLSTREAIVHYYLFEYFQDDLIIVLLKTVVTWILFFFVSFFLKQANSELESKLQEICVIFAFRSMIQRVLMRPLMVLTMMQFLRQMML